MARETGSRSRRGYLLLPCDRRNSNAEVKMKVSLSPTLKATLALCIATASTITASPNAAQNYPSKPLRIIVGSASGGGPDIAARMHASQLSLQFGQQVVVDNRPGAAGVIGYEMVARAAPDGYTVSYLSFPFATNPYMYSKLPYDSSKDFQPVILMGAGPNILVVSSALPIKSVPDLIEHARANPGKLSFGSSGVGTSTHLSIELLKSMTSTNLVHVPFKGIQQAITDLIGGRIHVVSDNFGSVIPHVMAGRVRALGVTSLKRLPVVPDMPTVAEAGFPGFEITPWFGYAFPARTPRDCVLRLNAELNRLLMLPATVTWFTDSGVNPIGGTPEHFAAHIRKEIDKWGKVIKGAGIQPL
jgi:tripartite-type tricarboxylate transporter receptor subunit TctC